jgi:serine/threonine protein kinase
MSTQVPRPSTLSVARERFGKYEIIRRLATGGMAEIYLARATGIEGFEKQVVLKRILPQYADDEEFVSMFLDEARLAATLHHSNVVQVYDIGAVDGQYFLSMELLQGQDGRHLVRAAARAGGLPIEHAVSIVMGVCAGLHYAHEHVVDGKPLELVHRDVSPQNVFITYDGHIKLLDFGIARASSRLTQTRGTSLKGKIAYMSPEQCAGRPLDRRSDVFSAAVLLWEMTTGRRLYTGDSDFEVMRKLREEDPPRPSTVGFAYPRALERIVLKGLKRDRNERYASAEELLLELEAFAREARMPVSSVRLSKYMRELFRDDIEAWNQRERGEALALAQPAEEDRTRTETSVPGPAPPIMYSDPEVPLPPPRRGGRAWAAVSIGLVVGVLATWMATRRETHAPASAPPVATATRVTTPIVTPLIATPPPATPPARAPAAERPAPPPRAAALPTPTPPPPPAVERAPAVEPAPVAKIAPKPIVAKQPLIKRAPPPPPRRAPKKPTPAQKTPTTKTPAGWDPESILPP